MTAIVATTKSIGMMGPEHVRSLKKAYDAITGRVGTVAKTITDWNDATEQGSYIGDTIANAPTTGWFMGHVEAQSTTNLTQTVHAFTSDSSTDTKSYRRERNSGTWGSWYRLRLSESEQSTVFLALLGAQVISGLKTITLGNATTLGNYLEFKPSDYGTGKPALLVQKSATADIWNVVLYDGTNNNGILNFTVQNLRWNGVNLATSTDIANMAKTNVKQAFSQSQRGAILPVTFSSSVTLDSDVSNLYEFSTVVNTDFTFNTFSNIANNIGLTGTLAGKIDAVGGRHITLGSNFKPINQSTHYDLPQTANALFYIDFQIWGATTIRYSISGAG